MSALPADTSVACLDECAGAVAREGDRDVYAVAVSPDLRAPAAEPRWQAAPVSRQPHAEDWMAFDPRSCPDGVREMDWVEEILAAFGIAVD